MVVVVPVVYIKIWWWTFFLWKCYSDTFCSVLKLLVLLTVGMVDTGKWAAAWYLWLCTTSWEAQNAFNTRKGWTTAHFGNMHSRSVHVLECIQDLGTSFGQRRRLILHLDCFCRVSARHAQKWWTVGVKTRSHRKWEGLVQQMVMIATKDCSMEKKIIASNGAFVTRFVALVLGFLSSFEFFCWGVMQIAILEPTFISSYCCEFFLFLII